MSTATETPPQNPAAARMTTSGRGAASQKSKRSPVKLIVGAIAAIAALVWLVHFSLHAYHYVETDNAYITGHLHQVSPQIDGQVKEVLVQDNQEVHAGDVLVRLDPAEFEIAVQKATASVAQARAQASEADASMTQADAQLEEATARVAQTDAQATQARAQLELARLTAGRTEQLFQNGGASTQAAVDNARSDFNAAQAAVAAASANHTAVEAAIGSARAAQKSAASHREAALANVAAAEAALQDAKRQLGYTILTAPTAGRVGNKLVESGNRVSAGQALLAITEPSPWIVANFKETQLPRMVVGQPVEITVDALPGQTFTGHIDSLSPASGAQFALLPPDNATGNFNKVVQRVPVKIVLDGDNRTKLDDRLRFGYSVIANVRVR